MPHRALIEHRPWLFASLVAAISYFIYADESVPGLFLTVWKGAGVGLLAVYAARRARNVDGWLLVAVMATEACADMALEVSFLVGGALFAIGHVVAIRLFLRSRRDTLASSQKAAAVALLIGTPVIAALLTFGNSGWVLATAYALIVGVMAACAWSSSFPRYRVGLGAVLFVISDLAIFARESGHITPALAMWLIWPLYYVGQFLITTGVVQSLRARAICPRPITA
ncbi:lysoplasmalogenase [Porphyrobacter algicida]|uniref:Lysoplasmalogenase n=1 Tax=Qipengyuania algicida TaxID=1836209 RepID=A0A845AH60_9SPHN|nr:lysoplasmalogenase family protein [Qipengyuania algicida]MXP28513.1 lysoplasmalogenase [Qipengyuania algicida]